MHRCPYDINNTQAELSKAQGFGKYFIHLLLSYGIQLNTALSFSKWWELLQPPPSSPSSSSLSISFAIRSARKIADSTATQQTQYSHARTNQQSNQGVYFSSALPSSHTPRRLSLSPKHQIRAKKLLLLPYPKAITISIKAQNSLHKRHHMLALVLSFLPCCQNTKLSSCRIKNNKNRYVLWCDVLPHPSCT